MTDTDLQAYDGTTAEGDDEHLVATPDRRFYAFVIDHLTERPEVADVNTSVVYEHIRRPVLEPLGELAER